jgi:hypothetical protein
MKVVRLTLILMLFSAVAYAQSDAEKSFDKLKTLSGVWEGKVTVGPPTGTSAHEVPLHLTLRTTSSGHALMHEITSPGSAEDPITMFYLDEGRLLLTHYCDAGNRPRLEGKISPDGKTLEFEFLDLAGNNKHHYMNHAKFTFIDANHHIEDWAFMFGDKPVNVHLDLRRTGDGAGAAKN